MCEFKVSNIMTFYTIHSEMINTGKQFNITVVSHSFCVYGKST
jgi:hypothetical protein